MLQVNSLNILGLSCDPFDLPPGECFSLSGPSGSGKSLFLRALADLDQNRGEISLDNVCREDINAPEWRRKVTYLAAEPGWWADRISDHFPAWPTVVERLSKLGLPNDCGNWAVAQASTGERQRLALLRSLTLSPQVLLLDEPTAALDGALTERVESLIADLRADGLAVIWVSHDRSQTTRVASRHFTIVDNRIALQ